MSQKMTQRFLVFWVTCFVCFSVLADNKSTTSISELEQTLGKLPNVTEIKVRDHNTFFQAAFTIDIKQLLDHRHPEKGQFTQRVFVSHKGFDKPVVLVTEGYGANYANNARYQNELCPLLDANLIVVEHRYFGESVPEPLDWEYLTIKNAAADHHRITTILKEVYKGKWVNTGISKGGTTCTMHHVFYPEDVDATVAYVGPVNFGVEDPREEAFLREVGTQEERDRIMAFQKEVLKRRDQLFPKWQAYTKEHGYSFVMEEEAVFDLCVLEYSFAFWQWGAPTTIIPLSDADDDTIFNHFVKISSPDYFAQEGVKPIQPFFYQAGTEFGYYGYDCTPFEGLLSITDAENYLYTVFFPKEGEAKYNHRTMKKVNRLVKGRKGQNIIYIYGEYDPWTASAVELKGRNNALKIVKKGGSHTSRINNLPDDQKQLVLKTLEDWLEIPIQKN